MDKGNILRVFAISLVITGCLVFFIGCDTSNDAGIGGGWPSFTVIYNGNGGIGNMGHSSHRHGENQSLNANVFVREGHTFIGWARSPNAVTIEFYDRQEVTNLTQQDGGIVTLYAVWRAHTYTVVYHAGGGFGNMETSVFRFGEERELRPVAFTHTETFLGWARVPAGSIAFRDRQPVKNLSAIDGDVINLYAIWGSGSFTVSFNLNGGTGAIPSALVVEAGQMIVLPRSNGFSRFGYAFNGWNTRADGTGDDFAADALFTPSSDITLFARWVTVFTVTFHANGGVGIPPPPMTDQGHGVILPAGSGLLREGFDFGGWNTRADGTGSNHGVSTIFRPENNITLYARWNPSNIIVNFTVSFNINGGTGTTPNPQTVATGSGVTLPSSAGFSRQDHLFIGWNTRADGTGTNHGTGAIFTPTEDTTLFARWSAFVTVSFNANGGTGTLPNSQTVEPGREITLPSGEGLSMQGHTFAGWNTRADGLGINHGAGTAFTPVDSIVLFARWNPVSNFVVSFNINNGTGTAPNPQTVAVGSSLTLPGSTGFFRSGHVFAGWNTMANGTGANHGAGTAFTPTSNITFYARWAATVTVSFNLNGGTGTIPPMQTVEVGREISLPPGTGLTKPGGFIFDGWNTQADGLGINFNANAPFSPQTNVMLFARWRDINQPVPGLSLAAQLAWLQDNALSGGFYTLVVTQDEEIPPQTLSYAARNNITLTLRGIGGQRTVSLSSAGAMFTIPADITLILAENITLQGFIGNTNALIRVENRGTFKMEEGAKITGNFNGSTAAANAGGGVHMAGGTFVMNGGEISGNNALSSNGGGVHRAGGTFTMNGGTISGNTANNGGGIYGSFTMNGGTITGNTARTNGGGVHLHPTSGSVLLIMNAGVISNNTAAQQGGGVNVGNSGVLDMRGGIISGNHAGGTNGGGGIAITWTGVGIIIMFRISNGVIYGSTAPVGLRNTGNNATIFLWGNSRGQHGIFSGTAFTSLGTLNSTSDTIRVVNGALQP